MKDSANLFNKDYFEDGVKQKLSGYENYRYLPTRSYEEAITLTEDIFYYVNKHTSILDLGCAKGYLVHALRQLGFNAYGEDISKYAIDNCHPSVQEYVNPLTDDLYDFIVCKDMMEHISEKEVLKTLVNIRKRCTDALFIIPFGDDDVFRIKEYEIDITHVTKKDEDWWINMFRDAGFRLDTFTYKLGAIKKKWTSKYPYGNGFFLVSSQ